MVGSVTLSSSTSAATMATAGSNQRGRLDFLIFDGVLSSANLQDVFSKLQDFECPVVLRTALAHTYIEESEDELHSLLSAMDFYMNSYLFIMIQRSSSCP